MARWPRPPGSPCIIAMWPRCSAKSHGTLPWQRVVGAGGEIKLKLEAGMEQRMRLEMEGVRFRGNGSIWPSTNTVLKRGNSIDRAALGTTCFQLLAQLGGEAGDSLRRWRSRSGLRPGHARGDDEIALVGGIGDIGENAAAFGGDADAVVDGAVVGGGEDEHGAAQVGGAEGAADDADGQGVEVGGALGGDHGDARAGFEQAAGFAQRDIAGADDEDGAVLEGREKWDSVQFRR